MFVRERDEAPRPARTRGGRVIVIASLLAIGAIAIAAIGWLSPDSDRASAPPTTVRASVAPSSAPGTTAVPPTTSEPATTVQTEATTGTVTVTTDAGMPGDGRPTGYIAAQLPTGFVPSGAFVSQGDIDQNSGSWLQIWAGPDASRSGGRWLAVSTSAFEWVAFDAGAPDVERVLIGDRYALQRTGSDGVRAVSFRIGDRSANIASFGFTDADVDEIVRGVRIDGRSAQPDFGESEHLLDGLDLIVSRSEAVSLDGPLLNWERQASYSSSDGNSGLSVTAGPQLPNDLVANRLLSAQPDESTPVTDTSGSGLDVADGAMVVGSSGAEPYRSQFVMWHDGPSTIMLSGSGEITLTELLATAASVRASSADEWQTLMQQHPNVSGSYSEGFSPPGSYTTVGQVTSASQTVWTLGLGVRAALMPPAPGTVWVQVESKRSSDDDSFGSTSSNLFTFQAATDRPESVTTYRFIDATVLVAAVNTANGASSAVALRMRLPGLEPIEVPLVPVMNSTISGAAYAFSQVGEYSAELVDANGDVITPLTPS